MVHVSTKILGLIIQLIWGYQLQLFGNILCSSRIMCGVCYPFIMGSKKPIWWVVYISITIRQAHVSNHHDKIAFNSFNTIHFLDVLFFLVSESREVILLPNFLAKNLFHITKRKWSNLWRNNGCVSIRMYFLFLLLKCVHTQ